MGQVGHFWVTPSIFVDCFAFGYVFFSNVPVCVCAFTAKDTSWEGSARFLMGMPTSFRGQAEIKGGYTRFFLNFETNAFCLRGGMRHSN